MATTLDPATKTAKSAGSSSSSSSTDASNSLKGSLLDPSVQAAVSAVASASGIDEISAAFTAAADKSPYKPPDRTWSGVEKVVKLEEELAQLKKQGKGGRGKGGCVLQ